MAPELSALRQKQSFYHKIVRSFSSITVSSEDEAHRTCSSRSEFLLRLLLIAILRVGEIVIATCAVHWRMSMASSETSISISLRPGFHQYDKEITITESGSSALKDTQL